MLFVECSPLVRLCPWASRLQTAALRRLLQRWARLLVPAPEPQVQRRSQLLQQQVICRSHSDVAKRRHQDCSLHSIFLSKHLCGKLAGQRLNQQLMKHSWQADSMRQSDAQVKACRRKLWDPRRPPVRLHRSHPQA